MAGWLFRDAPLAAGERLVFRRGANLRQGRRTVGGEVSVTDTRLVFTPNRLEHLVGARPVAVALADVLEAIAVDPPPRPEMLRGLPGGSRPRVEVDTADGPLLLSLEDAAALAAVLDARRRG